MGFHHLEMVFDHFRMPFLALKPSGWKSVVFTPNGSGYNASISAAEKASEWRVAFGLFETLATELRRSGFPMLSIMGHGNDSTVNTDSVVILYHDVS